MSNRIRLVQGDTRPDIIVDMVDRATWDPIDVSDAGASVYLKFRQANSDTVLTTITAEKLTGQLLSDGNIDTSVTTPGAGGRVMFSWPAGALDVDKGYYEGEVSINFSDSTIQTVYDLIQFYVREDM